MTRFVFNCSAHHRKRRSINTSLARTTSGAAPCVVDRWWSSKGSRLQKSNFVLHRSPLPHETTFSNSNPSRVSACSVPLRLAAKQISSSSFLSALSGILFRNSQLSPSSAVLQRTVSATLRTAVSHHSISIGPASAATTSGFLLTDPICFSEGIDRRFSPIQAELSFRISVNIAAYLEPPGRGRHVCFQDSH
jgi:hypothetical protein